MRLAVDRSQGRRLAQAALIALTALAAPVAQPATYAEEPVTIFAAASTADALDEVARAFEEGGGGSIRPVYAASSTLAQQIVRGAPADLYLSANVSWMDYLGERAAIDPGSRGDLLGNRLVLVAPAKRPLSLTIDPGFPLAAALGEDRLALGDPAHVPAGSYAKAALEALGVWPAIAPKAVYTGDVRAALALAEQGEVAAAVVYATDATRSRKVHVAGTFPAETHPPIVYPLARVAGRDRPAVRAFQAFLRGPRAAAIFRAHGFATLAPDA